MLFFQLQRGIEKLESKFFISGSIRLFLCILALYTTCRYNMSVSETNTELIVNTVIALFINDIDGQCLTILENISPHWTAERFKEIHKMLAPNTTEGVHTSRMLSNRFIEVIQNQSAETCNTLDEETGKNEDDKITDEK